MFLSFFSSVKFLICLVIFLSNFLLLVGCLTVLESSVLFLTQSSKGVSSASLFSFYHFYLDFFKILFKGGFSSVFFKKGGYILCLGFILLVMIFLFFNLPFNHFGYKVSKGFIIFIFLDFILVVLKIFLMNVLSFKVVYLFSSSMIIFMIYLEGFYLTPVVLLLLVLNSFGFYSWCSMPCLCFKLSFFSSVLFLLWLFLLFMVSLLKLFSTPFDYFEVESELVGGGVLEFQGFGFALWSLMEYGLILLNSLLLTYFIMSLFLSLWGFFLFTFLMVLMVFSSGVFVSLSFYFIFGFIFKTYTIICFFSVFFLFSFFLTFFLVG